MAFQTVFLWKIFERTVWKLSGVRAFSGLYFQYSDFIRENMDKKKLQIWEPFTQWLTAQKEKFSIKTFFSKYDQIRRKLWIWSHLLKKSFTENYFFFAQWLLLLCFKIRKPGQTLFLYLFIIIRTSSQTLTYFGFGYKVCIILLGKVLVVTIWKDIFIVLSTRHIQRLEYV